MRIHRSSTSRNGKGDFYFEKNFVLRKESSEIRKFLPISQLNEKVIVRVKVLKSIQNVSIQFITMHKSE